MSIYITKEGTKKKVNISATDVQLLDIDGRFKSKNLEDALKEVGSGTEENMTRIENKVEQLSNPNLLINGDFQIWQRGTSFSATNKTLYHADRWVVTSRKHNITQLSDKGGLRMTKSEIDDTGWFIRQRIPKEEYSKLLGCKVTLSCKFKTDGNQQGFEIYDRKNKVVVADSKYYTNLQEGIMSHTFKFEYDGNSDYLEISFIGADSNNPATYYEIEWMKMEFGELATPFVPKSYVEELRECQRYYISGENKLLGVVTHFNASNLYYLVPLPVEMHKIPTIVNPENVSVTSDTGELSGTTVSSVTKRANTLHIAVSCPNHGITSASTLKMYTNAGGLSHFDAEIY